MRLKNIDLSRSLPRGGIAKSVCGAISAGLLAWSIALPTQAAGTDYVDWLASYTGEAAANVKGGKQRGSAYAGQLFVGADIDMDKAAGWDNTRINVAFTNRHGQNLAQNYIGNSTPVQEIYGGQNSRLARFTIETSFLNGQLQLEAGRTVANISFLGSELCQYFQTNSACGNPTFVFRTSNFTWWQVYASTWISPGCFGISFFK
jgi:porin